MYPHSWFRSGGVCGVQSFACGLIHRHMLTPLSVLFLNSLLSVCDLVFR